MKARPHVVELLAFLSEAFPKLEVTPERVAVWSATLGEYSKEQLVEAAGKLARYFQYAAPSTGDVVQAIEGRVVREPIFARAMNGSRCLQYPGGPPVIEGWRELRVPYGQLLGETTFLEELVRKEIAG